MDEVTILWSSNEIKQLFTWEKEWERERERKRDNMLAGCYIDFCRYERTKKFARALTRDDLVLCVTLFSEYSLAFIFMYIVFTYTQWRAKQFFRCLCVSNIYLLSLKITYIFNLPLVLYMYIHCMMYIHIILPLEVYSFSTPLLLNSLSLKKNCFHFIVEVFFWHYIDNFAFIWDK